jgi:hypothetical protein
VSIEELKDAIKRMQKVPDDSLIDRISEVLAKMDIDKDGAIRLDDVLKVSICFECQKNVQRNDYTVEYLMKFHLLQLQAHSFLYFPSL